MDKKAQRILKFVSNIYQYTYRIEIWQKVFQFSRQKNINPQHLKALSGYAQTRIRNVFREQWR